MPNTQPPEAPVQGEGHTLELHSAFLTVQGEGPYSGHRAVFLRLAGCNLQCPGCDTEYTAKRETKTIAELISLADDLAGDLQTVVVITGGEPLRQPIGPLVYWLTIAGFTVQIESNGTVAPDDTLAALLRQMDGKVALVVSPKTKRISALAHELATCFKYVLDHRSICEEDGLPLYALEHERGGKVARPRPGAPVYVTPYDVSAEPRNHPMSEQWNDENRVAVAASAIKYGYIAGLQIHKYMKVE